MSSQQTLKVASSSSTRSKIETKPPLLKNNNRQSRKIKKNFFLPGLDSAVNSRPTGNRSVCVKKDITLNLKNSNLRIQFRQTNYNSLLLKITGLVVILGILLTEKINQQKEI